MNIKDVREARPIDMAEYAVKNHIADKPEFAWWVPYTLKKRNIIISKVKIKYWSKTHKCGVRLPKNVTVEMQIDQANGNTYRKDTIDKDMKKDRISYKQIEDCTQEEVRKVKVDDIQGYQDITCYVIFDVNMDFTRKARSVANGS